MSGLDGESLRAYPPTSMTWTTVGAATTADVAIAGTGFHIFQAGPAAGVWVRFGTVLVADAVVGEGIYLAPGAILERYVPDTVTHMTAIRAAGGVSSSIGFGKTGD